MPILCDLGGTHIRFGVDGGEPEFGRSLAKFPAADFSGFEEAVRHYANLHDISLREGVALAATGPLSRPWPVDATAAARSGVNILHEVSDFEASAWGVMRLGGDQLVTVRAGIGDPDAPQVILGPGTGLGLAYMIPGGEGGWRIQKTHGGHMRAALLSAEHIELAERISRLMGTGQTVIYEHFASGRGLPFLYRAVCQMRGETGRAADSAEDILAGEMDDALRTTLRVFHEVLGLFAHSCILTLNALGGLYLDGGIVQRLRERGLFDSDTVLRFMTLNPVATVRADLDAVPVRIVNEPFIALHGLAAMNRAGMLHGKGMA